MVEGRIYDLKLLKSLVCGICITCKIRRLEIEGDIPEAVSYSA